MCLRAVIYVAMSCSPLCAQVCDPRVSPPPGKICQSLIKSAVDDLVTLSEKYGEALGQEGKAVDSRIKLSRPAFFKLDVTSPNYAQTWNALSKDLDAKDLWYLQVG